MANMGSPAYAKFMPEILTERFFRNASKEYDLWVV
jgi:hypothetical protein